MFSTFIAEEHIMMTSTQKSLLSVVSRRAEMMREAGGDRDDRQLKEDELREMRGRGRWS